MDIDISLCIKLCLPMYVVVALVILHAYYYASVRMCRGHMVVGLCVILSFRMSVTPFSQRLL